MTALDRDPRRIGLSYRAVRPVALRNRHSIVLPLAQIRRLRRTEVNWTKAWPWGA